MNDVTFGIIVAGRIKGGAAEWRRSAPADLKGRSTVHFCQKDNRLFFLSAPSKQELENSLVAKIRIRVGP